jgi:hypothetical protein
MRDSQKAGSLDVFEDLLNPFWPKCARGYDAWRFNIQTSCFLLIHIDTNFVNFGDIAIETNLASFNYLENISLLVQILKLLKKI